MKKVKVYACGGLGMNIGSSLTSDLYDVAYIDSSKSNVNQSVDSEKVTYVNGIKGTGGSGGHRVNNYKPISEMIPSFISANQPADLNIVVFSLSGGTGSVAGPLTVGELLRNGHPTACVVLGDPTSQKFLDNTIATLKSLEGISAARGLPVVMNYHENGPQSWGDVDDMMRYAINAIAELGSQQNSHMDLMDVSNFFQYTKVTDAFAQLACLDIFDTRSGASKSIEPVAIASLYTNRDEYKNFGDAKYSIHGFPDKPIMGGDQLHFLINHSGVAPIVTDLQSHRDELARKYSAQKQRQSLVDRDDNVDDNGMVI
jgi:hypothetical protein